MELVSAKVLSGYVRTVESLGHDPVPIILAAGLTPELLIKPNYWDVISLDKIVDLLRRSSEITGCGHLGALIGYNQKFSDLGDLGQLVKLSSDIESALHTFIRYLHLYWQQAARIRIEKIGSRSYLHLETLSTEDPAQFFEGIFIAICRMLELLSGKRFQVTEVQFAHRTSSDVRVYSKMFKAPVKFNQEKNLLVFSSDQLNIPIDSSDEHLKRILHRYIENLNARYKDDIVSKVNELIERSMQAEKCSVDSVASMLSVHRRTLHRMLKKQGTSFTQLLEQYRQAKSKHLLIHTELQVTAIASSLGYSDSPAFNHAFIKWYGLPPIKFRHDMRDQ